MMVRERRGNPNRCSLYGPAAGIKGQRGLGGGGHEGRFPSATQALRLDLGAGYTDVCIGKLSHFRSVHQNYQHMCALTTFDSFLPSSPASFLSTVAI